VPNVIPRTVPRFAGCMLGLAVGFAALWRVDSKGAHVANFARPTPARLVRVKRESGQGRILATAGTICGILSLPALTAAALDGCCRRLLRSAGACEIINGRLLFIWRDGGRICWMSQLARAGDSRFAASI